MKPRTKAERRIVELSASLRKITEKQEQYAFEKCFDCKAFFTKKRIICTECGHQWPNVGMVLTKHCHCPKCERKLEMEQTQKIKLEEVADYSIITTVKEYQVVRFFEVFRSSRVGRYAWRSLFEVVQHWIGPKGELFVVARSQNMGAGGWLRSSELSLKEPCGWPGSIKPQYCIWPEVIHPSKRFTEELKRRGVGTPLPNNSISPSGLFRAVLTDSRAETLHKAGYPELLGHLVGGRGIARYWDSIKICLRNQYPIKDPGIWTDYIDLLSEYGKDLHNARYVCPEDLMQEHDRWVAKKQRAEAARRVAWERGRAARDAEAAAKRYRADKRLRAEFKRRIARFADLRLSDGDIQIVVLQSLSDFKREGQALSHCVYVAMYYERKDVLILSARRGDTILETIEFSLKELTVLQCRGKHNQSSPYHDKILELMNNNKRLIKQRLTDGRKHKTA